MSYLEMSDTRLGLFDAGATEKKGLELTAQYNAAQPYPHIEIDDFLPPVSLKCASSFFPRCWARGA